jgi:hypothetical protein
MVGREGDEMNKKGFMGIITIIIGLILIAFFIYGILYAITEGSETIKIKEKWIKYHGDDAKYLVSSTNGQVFQITDTIIKWRWDSSNLYASIDEGDKCTIKTQGWRFPLFSDYKNILEADC